LRQRCHLRTATLCAVLKNLSQRGQVRRQPDGYRCLVASPREIQPATGPAPLPTVISRGERRQPVQGPPTDPPGLAALSQPLLPLEPAGNGNGKPAAICFSGG
jgi:hypothetical protein